MLNKPPPGGALALGVVLKMLGAAVVADGDCTALLELEGCDILPNRDGAAEDDEAGF